jgi:hypothetical protein
MKHSAVVRTLAKLSNLHTWPSLLMVFGLLVGIGGCTRTYFRKSADNEVEGVLGEKDTEPLWKIEQFHVYPDARSRFADPSNPDHPPMPPDDYATFARSPHPQQPGKGGVGYVQGWAWLEMIKVWDADNRERREAADAAEETQTAQKDDEKSSSKDKPELLLTAPATKDSRHPVAAFFDEPLKAKQPGFLLNLDQSIELGVLNSPQYQTFREELYEAALPVTQQRFNFTFQWAAGEDFIREWAGRGASSGSSKSVTVGSATDLSASTTPTVTTGPGTNNWTGLSTVSFTKLFVSGALLTFDFVNTNVWNFLGQSPFTSTSTVNLSLTQPFLQGGGRAVTLEPLTQAERNLFYAIRAYARFREQFFVSVALGSSLPGSLASASGTGSGSSPISALAALGIASTDVSGGFVGYLSTLFRECDLAADQKLVLDLERALRIYEGYQEGGLFSPLQVSQVRSTLLQAQNTVLTDQQFVNNAVDQFKLVLGLPANLPLILDDAPAREITHQYDRYYAVITDSDAAHKSIERQEELAPGKLRAVLLEIYTRGPLVRGTEYQKTLPVSWATWARASDKALQDRLDQLREKRRKTLDRKTELEVKGQSLSDEETRRLRADELETDIGALEQVLRRYEDRPWEKRATPEQRQQDRSKLFRLVAYSAEVVLVGARNERLETVAKLWPELPKAPLGDLDLSTEEVQKAQQVAVQHSLTNRWDLMNARAELVDSWRQLRVTANALMGVFNVQYNLQSTTPVGGAKPFAFSTSRTSSDLSLDTQLPLNRLAQRNAYRIALINYQQQRRALMVLEDNIAVQVRFDVRQLQLFAANYTIQKRVIESLYAQVESALEVITAPADPSQLQTTGSTAQATAAALTNQYLGALNSLNGAQTRMYDIWLSYQATRMQLYLDLESLRMDNRGVWLMQAGSDGSRPSSTEGASKLPASLPPVPVPDLPAPKPVDK